MTYIVSGNKSERNGQVSATKFEVHKNTCKEKTTKTCEKSMNQASVTSCSCSMCMPPPPSSLRMYRHVHSLAMWLFTKPYKHTTYIHTEVCRRPQTGPIWKAVVLLSAYLELYHNSNSNWILLLQKSCTAVLPTRYVFTWSVVLWRSSYYTFRFVVHEQRDQGNS